MWGTILPQKSSSLQFFGLVWKIKRTWEKTCFLGRAAESEAAFLTCHAVVVVFVAVIVIVSRRHGQDLSTRSNTQELNVAKRHWRWYFRPSMTVSRISPMKSCTCCHCHGGPPPLHHHPPAWLTHLISWVWQSRQPYGVMFVSSWRTPPPHKGPPSPQGWPPTRLTPPAWHEDVMDGCWARPLRWGYLRALI